MKFISGCLKYLKSVLKSFLKHQSTHLCSKLLKIGRKSRETIKSYFLRKEA